MCVWGEWLWPLPATYSYTCIYIICTERTSLILGGGVVDLLNHSDHALCASVVADNCSIVQSMILTSHSQLLRDVRPSLSK